MNLSFDSERQQQCYLGPKQLQNPDLIYVLVAIAAPVPGASNDRFFILTEAQLQLVCIHSYSTWMEGHGWRRPKSPESYDLRYEMRDVLAHEDKWERIEARMSAMMPSLQE